MARFFKEVEFSLPDFEEEKPKKPGVFWDKAVLKKALKEIQAEIEKIKVGKSEYTTYAINPGKFPFPAENAIKAFVSNPSDRTFLLIREISNQDFGARAGEYFFELLKKGRVEVPNG